MANNQGGNAQNNPGNFADDRDQAGKAGQGTNQDGNAHESSSDEAREAGRKGGQNSR